MSDDLGIVVIGRNEGERLVRCLASVRGRGRVVYVDSGSTDGSVAAAEAAGARVVSLDLSIPFTAARARNAGDAALGPDVRLIQFVDGDCAVQPKWLDTARAEIDADPGLAAVFGRRREMAPETSIYNWLCDVEWAVPPGPVRQFGGDVMLRRDALERAGGYPDEMIAGEEPDLSMRLVALGWRMACLPAEMTLHDAAITHFRQWWRRAERSGHAYAELEVRHPGEYRRRVLAALFWGAAIPGSTAILLVASLFSGSSWPALVALVPAMLLAVQFVRVAWSACRGRPLRDAVAWSWFLLLDKPPHALGIARYWVSRWRGKRTPLIEYKARAA